MLPRVATGMLLTTMLATLLAMPSRGADAVQDERLAAYKEFRAAFDAADYARALPFAVQVVAMTKGQFGADSAEMANPGTNLATTYYRMGRNAEALDGYRAVLTLLDQQGDAINPLLIRPLHGVGATLRKLGRDEEAIAPLKRAVAITRNREGMHAPEQLPLLKDLIACYMSSGRIMEAGTEQQYAFTVAETTYGRNDIRMLGPLDEYARWNEAAGRYSAARTLHLRAVQLADSVLGTTTLQSVNGLRGIARSYRLAFVFGEPEEETKVEPAAALLGAPPVTIQPTQTAEGERALRNAVQRIAMAIPAQPKLMGEVQTDLGDWYMTGGLETRAVPMYQEAWQSLVQAQAQDLLAMPVPLTYHPPPIAVSRGLQDPDAFVEQQVELQVTVDAQGRVRETQALNPSPEKESAEKAVAAAVKRSAFRPAIKDGVAVTSSDYVFRERVYVKRPKSRD